jgi:hypothetical protein
MRDNLPIRLHNYNVYQGLAMNIHLVIATHGEYSEHRAWIVQVFTNEAEAIAEATRLNAARQIASVLFDDYRRLSGELRTRLAKSYLAAEGRSTHHGQFYHLPQTKRSQVDHEIELELGPEPEYPEADDYTVVSVPIGERGEWELP